jgi:beta-lactam-binding protein with PASTA domain
VDLLGVDGAALYVPRLIGSVSLTPGVTPSPLHLTVSTPVPNVVAMSVADATAALQAVGLQARTVMESHGIDVDTGNVVAQEPQAGREVPFDSLVTLIVSRS